ncbi:MAG: hypothetical protein ACREFW_11035, partial [Rhizomicrobium sp.]
MIITAVGPTSATDPVAGEVEVAQFVQGNGGDTSTAAAVTIKAYDAITTPSLTASAGSVALAAGGNIAIPTLTALDNINSAAGGTTTLGSATATNGTMTITSGGTISFSTLISGGAMNVTSTAGDIVGTAATVGNASAPPAGAAFSGVGLELASLSATGASTLTATGPEPAPDQVAGNVIILVAIHSIGGLAINAPTGSITAPLIAASAGPIGLAAGEDAAVPN